MTFQIIYEYNSLATLVAWELDITAFIWLINRILLYQGGVKVKGEKLLLSKLRYLISECI